MASSFNWSLPAAIASFTTIITATNNLTQPPPPAPTTTATLCHCDVTNMTSCCPDGDDVTEMAAEVTSTVFYPWNNPYNLISLQTLQTIEKVVTCGLNPLLLAVGLPCNALCCLVFRKQGLRDRMNVSLFSLALVDLCCIVFWFLLGSFCLVSHLHPNLPFPIDWWKWNVRKYVRGFHRGFLFSSGCLTMLISVERCICVTLPLKAANLIATRTMTSLIVTIVTSLHLLCLVYPFKFDVVSTYDAATGQTIINLPGTPYYLRHQELLDFLENYVIMSVIPSVTFVVVTIATLITVIKLRSVMLWREKSAAGSSNKRSQVALVKMLVVVSCIYIVTASPNVILGIIRSFNSDLWLTGRYRNTFVASHLLYLSLGTVNSTVNFFVYLARSSRFRVHLLSLLPSCCSSSLLHFLSRRKGGNVTSRTVQDVTSMQTKPVSSCLEARVSVGGDSGRF
ncbi:hypothetical protein ACOMHN_036813 [Nucella lapillus]